MIIRRRVIKKEFSKELLNEALRSPNCKTCFSFALKCLQYFNFALPFCSFSPISTRPYQNGHTKTAGQSLSPTEIFEQSLNMFCGWENSKLHYNTPSNDHNYYYCIVIGYDIKYNNKSNSLTVICRFLSLNNTNML